MFMRYFCEEPSMVNFEEAAGGQGVRLGPFSKIWVEDGVLHAGFSEGEIS